MKNCFENGLPAGWAAVAVSALGLLLCLYPGPSGIILAKVFSALALLFGLYRLIVHPGAADSPSRGAADFILGAAVFLLGLLCFIRPRLLLTFLFAAAGILLILLALLRIPAVADQWARGPWLRLLTILSALLPLVLGLLFVLHPLGAAAVVIRLVGLLLLLFGLADMISGAIIKGRNGLI